MRRVGQLYHYWLHEAPLLTKVLTAATLSGLGDRIAQRLEASSSLAVDPERHTNETDSALVSASTARTLRMMAWGGLFTAPIMHTWFHLIERAIPGTGKVAVAKKVAADMVIMAPAMALGFFTVTKSMEGERLGDAFEIAKAKLQPTLSMNYKVWPLANLMVFSVVPFQYRTPFVNCVSLGWSTFLSGMANKKLQSAQEAGDAVAQ
ncbi:Adenosine deaminase [Phytophthora cinnamomi]|uniref:Adenosine deaminase n=1 Tax=Phytophthora cinnamomi TaxID=4785 RepID=UPI003559AE7C|nr:Adenosine deaminase [Phytophthora cinnamomi]